MVRDLILDIKERDLSLIDKSNSSDVIFDSVWGNLFDEDEQEDVLICNVLVPEMYWGMIKYEDNELIFKFRSVYMPDTRNFMIRLVAIKDGNYSLFKSIRGNLGTAAVSFAMTKNMASPIAACMLPYINIEGNFLVRLIENSQVEALDKAYVYSICQTDLEINFSDDQASQLLSLCGPGKYYRYPTTGVDIIKYLNRVVSHTDLYSVLETQFEADNRPIMSAEFDNETCNLDVLFRPEKEISDENLQNIDDLNMAFFDQFTDEFVRRNTVLTETESSDFISLIEQYERMLCLLIFIDSTTESYRIADKVEEGCFDAEGNILPDDDYYIVSATLDPDSIIMFDDEFEDSVKDAPIFIINDYDETRLYTSLIEQPYWITAECHKCFILKKRSTVRYLIRKDQFAIGKGLYIIPQISANIKNMLGLVQDINTGRLIGIISNSTNISDITLEEVTQHIYASQLSE